MLRHAKLIGLTTAIIISISSAVLARGNDAKQYGSQYGYQDGYPYGRDAQAQGFNYDYRSSEDFRLADRGYDSSMGEHDEFQSGYRNGYKAGYNDGYYGRASRYNGNDSYSRNSGPYSRNGRNDPYPRNNGPYTRDNGPYSRNDGPYSNGGYDPNGRNNRNVPYTCNGGDGDDHGYGNGRDENGGNYGNNGYGRYANGGSASDFGYRDGLAQGQNDQRNGKEFRSQKSEKYEDANHGYRKEFGDKNYYKGQYRQAFVRGYQDGYGR